MLYFFYTGTYFYESRKGRNSERRRESHLLYFFESAWLIHYKNIANLLSRKTEFRDAGVYMCNASNKLGHQSASGSLVVKEKTRITNGPQNYEAEAGSTATFRCIAQHDPSLPMKIRWFKDGQYISVNTNNRFVQSSDHSLAILRTTELDSGIYTCMAETDLDHVDAQAQLIVQDVPNPPVLK